MCGIAGFCDFSRSLDANSEANRGIVSKMGQVLSHRGPNDFGTYISSHAAFAHTRLAVIDPERGIQPMKKKIDGHEYCLVYNGELYNTEEIRTKLCSQGFEFQTTSDTEVLLMAYIAYGTDCTNHLNGIFSFAVWDSRKNRCFLCRDRFGVKPLFYVRLNHTLVFGSEIKALFQYPGIEPILDKNGLNELFGLGPARSPGCGVFKNIHEVLPGFSLLIHKDGMESRCYWKLEALEHTDTYEQTVEKTNYLLFDSIKRQLVSDVPIATLLSGGLDSSIISSVASRTLQAQGRILDTYSFDYEDNSQYFKASAFQPDEDRPFVDIMVNAIGSKHTFLQCDSNALYECLFDAVDAKDLPGMADVDSSLLYFSRGIKQKHTVCLSGECADEVFGGYPWFRDPDAYQTNAFPWSKNLDFRKEMLDPSLLQILSIDTYVRNRYEETLDRVPRLFGESSLAARQREISYLNTSWFMTTLLDRKDRMTMASGLEVRVPFSDHRLIQYLYNVPWDFKYHNQEVKGLLKDAAKDVLPYEVLNRKKCPYPKTYNPEFEILLKRQLTLVLSDKKAPLNQLINKTAVLDLMNSTSDYGRPWFGQLMAVPQMYAYLLQINYWLTRYHVKIEL